MKALIALLLMAPFTLCAAEIVGGALPAKIRAMELYLGSMQAAQATGEESAGVTTYSPRPVLDGNNAPTGRFEIVAGKKQVITQKKLQGWIDRYTKLLDDMKAKLARQTGP